MSEEIKIPVPVDISSNEIIRSLVGSTLYGTGEPGQEDTDYMGVAVEPISDVLGLGNFENWVWRTQPEGVRSGPGDIDITIYGLRKWLRLATGGNPSILILLFVPKQLCPVYSYWGESLQDLAPAILSKRIAAPYMGYCKAQRERLEDVRGGRHTNRPELIERYGYDTKYAMHALRLAYQGQEILDTGHIELPIEPVTRDILFGVRTGQYKYDEFLALLNHEEKALIEAADQTKLPDLPDYDSIEKWMIDACLNIWNVHNNC